MNILALSTGKFAYVQAVASSALQM